jgi:hypothetical protein
MKIRRVRCLTDVTSGSAKCLGRSTVTSHTKIRQSIGGAAPTVRLATGMRVISYSLADPEMAQRLAALQSRLQASPDAGTKLLKDVGILNRSGKLSKKFGG